MKKSKFIKLVLISSLIIAVDVNAQNSQNEGTVRESVKKSRLHVRGDTADKYTRMHTTGGRYFWFHPNGYYYNGGYHRTGYTSSAFSRSSYGHSSSAPRVSRGGFGRAGSFRVSS